MYVRSIVHNYIPIRTQWRFCPGGGGALHKFKNVICAVRLYYDLGLACAQARRPIPLLVICLALLSVLGAQQRAQYRVTTYRPPAYILRANGPGEGKLVSFLHFALRS
jgi:hypothetical protein